MKAKVLLRKLRKNRIPIPRIVGEVEAARKKTAPVLQFAPGIRVVVSDEDGFNYLGTVKKVTQKSIHVEFDDGRTEKIHPRSKRWIGYGVAKHRKSAIPANKLGKYLRKEIAVDTEKKVVEEPELPKRNIKKQVPSTIQDMQIRIYKRRIDLFVSKLRSAVSDMTRQISQLNILVSSDALIDNRSEMKIAIKLCKEAQKKVTAFIPNIQSGIVSSKETVETWQAVRKDMSKVQDILADILVFESEDRGLIPNFEMHPNKREEVYKAVPELGKLSFVITSLENALHQISEIFAWIILIGKENE